MADFLCGISPLGLAVECNRYIIALVFILKAELKRKGIPDHFGGEVDVVIDEDRIVRADAVWLTPEDWDRQKEATTRAGKSDPRRTRILIAPTFVIESISPGHERHDETTKRRWYAEFGILNYWLLDSFSRSLKCLALDGEDYRVDAEGRGFAVVKSSLFPGLSIALKDLWLDA